MHAMTLLLWRALFGLLSMSPFLLAQVDAHAHHHHGADDHRCATAEPQLRDQLVERLRFQGAFGGRENRRLLLTDCNQLCDQCIEIEVNLHLILGNVTGFGVLVPHPTDVVLDLLNGRPGSRQDLSTAQDIVALFEDNIAVVNRAYQGTPFRFRFTPEGTTTTVNNDWSNGAVESQQEIGRALGSRDLRKLDVFVAWSLQESESGRVLGIATLPAAQLAGEGDGVILRYDVLTGGGLFRSDYGHTLTHEIGKSGPLAICFGARPVCILLTEIRCFVSPFPARLAGHVSVLVAHRR